MQKLEADKDFYINYALEIARCERLLGFKVLETGDAAILALYAAKAKIQKEHCFTRTGLILFKL